MTLGGGEISQKSASVTGPGHQLSIAREAADLTLGDVASYLHLDIRTIEALERDEYGQLPAPMFVRGYLRGYARLLKLRPEPIIDAFNDNGLAPPALVADIADEPQAHTGDVTIRIITFTIVGGLVALVFLWWQNQNADPEDYWQSLSATTTPLSAVAPVAAPSKAVDIPEERAARNQPDEPLASLAATTTAQETPMASAESLVVEEPSSGTSGPMTEPTEALLDPNAGDPAAAPEIAEQTLTVDEATDGDPDIIATPEVVPASEPPIDNLLETVTESNELLETLALATPIETSEPAAERDAAPREAETVEETLDLQPETPVPLARISRIGDLAGKDSLTLRFGHESWVEVYDRDDGRLFFDLVGPGSVLEIQGNAPMNVLIGYTEDTEVVFNGSDFDFAPFVSKGVARFTLGEIGSPRAEAPVPEPASTVTEPEVTATPADPEPVAQTAQVLTQEPAAPDIVEVFQPEQLDDPYDDDASRR